jgi:hypothetical protein
MSAHMIEPRCQITVGPYTPPVSGHLRQSGKMVSSCRAIVSSPPADEVRSRDCDYEAKAIRRPRDTPIWEAGAGLGIQAKPTRVTLKIYSPESFNSRGLAKPTARRGYLPGIAAVLVLPFLLPLGAPLPLTWSNHPADGKIWDSRVVRNGTVGARRYFVRFRRSANLKRMALPNALSDGLSGYLILSSSNSACSSSLR